MFEKFLIPGVDGAVSDAREVFALLSVLFLSNWVYSIGVALLATLGGPYDSLITTGIMHLSAVPLAWFMLSFFKKKLKEIRL
ncbi:MAG: hypothetical protein B6241_07550 [Spirochaetaceae bacterium 4572_59]|nr:MAG: hypothetical protein B6241_07550 [Spirochaetaceae bacterium 4572_59]